MKDIGGILLLILLVFIIIWLYTLHRESVRKKKKFEAEQARQRELERQLLFDFFRAKHESIKSANNKFLNFLALETGYFTSHQLTTWTNLYSKLFNEVKGKSFESINLSTEELKSIKTFVDHFTKADSLRNNFNKGFVIEELKVHQSFFDNIEGRKLDIQQRTAVVTDEDNNVVIAGAGSGKTTTIVGKVSYVLKRYKVRPEEILLISFTKKSADTLAARISIDGIEARTFHKFGKDVIIEAEGRQPSIFDEAQFRPLITRYFNELISKNEYLRKVTDYFTNFLKPVKSQFDFDNRGEYVQYLKDQNFKSYKLKEVSVSGRMTYKMEVVKSIEECKIANFLLFNGVNYEYEFPYEHDTATESFRQYKPDFTVIQNGKKIYVEHFGIARNGNVPNWFSGDGVRSATQKYRDDMEWKRATHKSNGTTLIESYSYEMSEGTLFDNLTRNLKNAGVVLTPKSPEQVWKIITEATKDEVSSFITLFGTFITLMKSNNYSINDLVNRNKQTTKKFDKERTALFIDILKPIFERYQNHLIERNEIDFSDMINKAAKYISDGKQKQKFAYVIIDEFQDISIGRYQLVKAIKTINPSCKLFCVGDDWQSIYRFSGSDIALFKDFEKYFGYTVRSKIETTYRFHNPLINLSSEFILRNPNQAKKDLKGISDSKNTDFKILYSTTDNQDDTFALKTIFDELMSIYENIEEKEIIVLGRYGFDIDRIINQNSIFLIDKEKDRISYSIKTQKGETKKIIAQFLTVHKAKGLEGDIVVVLNCNSGKYGFPSEMSDDNVLNLLLSEADQFENGEERRLFYVAMTRAKERLFFISDNSYKSKFISELEVESGISKNKKCPNCKTADIVLRKSGTAKNGNTYKFFGCTNYLYGCEYTTTEWTNN